MVSVSEILFLTIWHKKSKLPMLTVPTVFWFDNYDSLVENDTGAGSIHNTPGVAFQDEPGSSFIRPSATVSKSKKRSLSLEGEEMPGIKVSKINPKKNPQKLR